MRSLNNPSEESRIRKELEALAARWATVSAEARAKVTRTEFRTATAYALFPYWFESANMTPGKRVDKLPAKDGSRYGLDDEGRMWTAEHFEAKRSLSKVAALYERDRHTWLHRVGSKTFVKAIRFEKGRASEWYETAQDSLSISNPTYDDGGRLVEIIRQTISQYTKGKVMESRDRLEYDASGVLLRITRFSCGMEEVRYRAKTAAGKPKAGEGPSPAQAAKTMAAVVERFLKAHSTREALAVAVAYDEETSSPIPPFLGVIWRDDFQKARQQGMDANDLLNPAEHDAFDIPELSLEGAKLELGVSSVGAQRKYYVEVARALSAELNRSRGKKARKLVAYATDLECSHLSKNLAELGIKKVAAD
jgi:hypothetical protein